MNIIDLLESPGMGRPRNTIGIQSAADQSAASVIGSGTTKHEDKKKPVTMMGKNVKEAVEEAAVKPNFKMPPESLQDKMYRQHQELRKQRGAPSPEEYKQRIAQKQAEIDALKEGILDRAAPKLPKPRNPADQVLQSKVNAGGRHLDKKRRQDLNPKHKHKDPLAESTGPLNWTVHFDDGTSQQVTVPSDEFDVRGYFAKQGKKVAKIDYSFAAQDRQDAPQRATSDPAARADQERKAHIAHDRGLTEQAVKITDYELWSDEVKALGGEIHPQKDRNLLVAQSWDGEEIGKFHLGKSMGFINQSGDLDETIRKMGSQYRLLSKKGKNLGTFDSKAGAEKHEREVQYFKHKNMEEGVAEGWKGKVAGAALAGAAALGGGDVDAQNIDLPGPQAVMIAHIVADVNGREVNKTVNLGTQYDSKEQAEQDLEDYMQSKGITRYSIRVEQSYEQPGTGYSQGRRSSGYATGGYSATGPISAPGLGDMIAGKVSREIRAGIPSKGGYATGGTNRGERPRDGSQWWRDQLPQMREGDEESVEEGLKDPKDNPCWKGYKPVGTKEKAGKTVPNCVPTNEEVESHLYLMSRAGYDIVQEEWSDKYKDSINCSNPKGFSQKAHCAGKKKNEDVSEEKVRLDPKCWKGKKIGNPKTKMKGGVRVNNCVPK